MPGSAAGRLISRRSRAWRSGRSTEPVTWSSRRARPATPGLQQLGIGAERIGRWDRGVDLARFDPALRTPGLLPDAINVLYAGRLTKEKGVELLADAFLAARWRDPTAASGARRRRPRGAGAARPPRRSRHVPRMARRQRPGASIRQRRHLPVRERDRHVRAGAARSAGERPAGRRGRQGRPGVADRERRNRPADRARRRRPGGVGPVARRAPRCCASGCAARRSPRSASARGRRRCSGSPPATAGRCTSVAPPRRGASHRRQRRRSTAARAARALRISSWR